MGLQRPPTDLAKLKVRLAKVDVSKLFRISRHETGEPYFGRSGANRFDAPDRSYGTCYCGFDLQTALAETVLHDVSPQSGVWSAALHAHPDGFDGILYMSRHVNDRKAAVLFEVAKRKFAGFTATPLAQVRGLGRVQAGLGIRVVYP